MTLVISEKELEQLPVIADPEIVICAISRAWPK